METCLFSPAVSFPVLEAQIEHYFFFTLIRAAGGIYDFQNFEQV
jgi:hypothetical protein